VPALVAQMGQAFPELVRAEASVTETLLLEEKRFRKTLDRGMRLLDEEIEGLGEYGELDGEVAFKLYDTYGFPLDLTQDALRTKNMTVDEDGFKAAMERQKAEARAAWKGSGSSATEAVWFEAQEEFGATEFIGYSTTHAEGKILQIASNDTFVEEAVKGDKVTILVNQTPFYGESGGQVGDVGTFKTEQGAIIEIKDTEKKLGKLHIHIGTVVNGSVSKNDVVEMNVNVEYRDKIRANHSVTHILHAALRNNLGDHLTQKGSLVAADKMRFDISHSKAVTAEEIKKVEDEVNSIIRQNTEVTTRLMTPNEAIDAGAMALFGEKYGDEVRVVAMGQGQDGKDYSVELCGGTHVRRTGDIGYFKIVSEGAVSSGVRRLEVLTSDAACDYSAKQEALLVDALSTLKTTPSDLVGRLGALLNERKSMEKEIADLQKKVALGGGGNSSGDDVKEIAGVKFLGQVLEGIPAKELRGLADDAKKRIGSGVVAFIAVNEGKAAVLTAVTDDLKDKISAVDLVRAGANAVGGKGGGGRPDMAQAGGPDGSNAADAIKAIEGILG
jgi:alanyl-tRNA synthetase